MLDRNSNRNPSPFQFAGVTPQPKSQPSNTPPAPAPPENNRTRTFRRAGNICEITAGASLNSAVIFTFHLLQVHPVGMFLALGVSHFYFTATATGEEGRKITNIMSGCSASLALLCSLSESMSEWWEAETSKSTAAAEMKSIISQEIPQISTSTSTDNSGWLEGLGSVLVLGVVVLILFNLNGKKRS
ncbi:hypothetical protein [Nostoc sp. UHCC 0870]|uniref:hypothetical protein n=1 Tax=Nostoc sp. UHCC 0870 TaxID=2914041 RepID=UPI001EDF27CE|nr:hypothetical protein [Nostoc sp. UHCC 0870]UKP01457.1 hypothetical protein L6494_30090 [Nostoc sp. UHCC 0870]